MDAVANGFDDIAPMMPHDIGQVGKMLAHQVVGRGVADP
jgi:hypothetical protein